MDKKCPYRFGMEDEKCQEHACVFYTHLVGKNSQTGLDQDEWGCAIAWLPILLVENAARVRQNSAELGKVREAAEAPVGLVKSLVESLNDGFQKVGNLLVKASEGRKQLAGNGGTSGTGNSGSGQGGGREALPPPPDS